MSAKHLIEWMHDFKDMSVRPLPMPATESFMKSFNTAEADPDERMQQSLKNEYKFAYRSGIGEIIYAMVTCRPDVSTAVVKCAQHSSCPAKPHYNAVRHILHYLYAPRDNGIYFWRPKPREDLPDNPLPTNCGNHHGELSPSAKRPQHKCLEPYAFADSAWADCLKTQRSTAGVSIKIAGGTIAYKTKLQPTVAMSSTEAEFMAASDAGKMILFIRSIMWDLGVPQQAASILYEDNDGCTAMANAQKPTSRTRHMDIRYFALSEWVERDLILLERIDTSVNEADHFTKILERTLFYRHADHIMGHILAAYSPCYNSAVYPGTVIRNDDVAHDDLVIQPEAAQAAKCYLSLDNWTHVLAHTHVPVQSNLLFHSHIGLWGGGC
jgi:hypothetical protein